MNREHKSNKRSKIFTTDCITMWYSGQRPAFMQT